MKYNLKYCINISCVVFFKIKLTWNYFVLYEWNSGSSMISHRFGIHPLEKFIHIIYHLFFIREYRSSMTCAKIFFHVTKYFIPCVKKISWMLARYSWKDLFKLTCSCSCVHHSCSHIHKITSLSLLFQIAFDFKPRFDV